MIASVGVPSLEWRASDAASVLLRRKAQGEVVKRATSSTILGGLPTPIGVVTLVCRVAASADDWIDIYPAGSTTDDDPTLEVVSNNSVEPATSSVGIALIDTSGIPDNATVISAKLHWISEAYSKSEAAVVARGVSVGTYSWTSDEAPEAEAEESIDLDAAGIAAISKSGKTQVSFGVSDPGGELYQEWSVRAYDYDDEENPGLWENFGPWLVVKYALPGSAE